MGTLWFINSMHVKYWKRTFFSLNSIWTKKTKYIKWAWNGVPIINRKLISLEKISRFSYLVRARISIALFVASVSCLLLYKGYNLSGDWTWIAGVRGGVYNRSASSAVEYIYFVQTRPDYIRITCVEYNHRINHLSLTNVTKRFALV